MEAGTNILSDLLTDIRLAFRQYRRRPAFSILGTLTLALGIGATVSIFSVVRGTLIRPLPAARAEELKVFWSDGDWTEAELDFIKPIPRSFSGLTAYDLDVETVGTVTGNVTGLAALTTANFFDVLGRSALLGHTFERNADQPGAPPSVVISWGLWQRQFGGSPDVIGKLLKVDGSTLTVVGVMPRDFWFPTPATELWRPLTFDPSSAFYDGYSLLTVLGRSGRGVSEADLSRDVKAISEGLGKRFTYREGADRTKNASLQDLRPFLLGDVKPALLLLMGAVVALLVMACANVAALVLSRTTDRMPELSIRTALGAGRGRLVRQILGESLVLALVAGLLGSALAAATFRLLLTSVPLRGGLAGTLTVDWSMFASALGVALVVTLAVAIAPARSIIAGALRGIDGSRSAQGLRGGHRRFYGALVSVQIGMGVLLASGALLLVKSVSRLYARDPGFVADRVVALTMVAPPSEMDSTSIVNFYQGVATAALKEPGVRSAALINHLPIRDGGGQGPVRIESRPDLSGTKRPTGVYRLITPGYLGTMGIPLMRGRDFTDADRRGSLRVAIVSEQFAAKMWPGKDPLGQRFSGNGLMGDWATVVGVAHESRLLSMTGDNPMMYYVPFAQTGYVSFAMTLVARSDGATPGTIAGLQSLIRRTEPRIAIDRVTSMSDVVSTALADRLELRFHLSVLAALALVLGAVGVYGVVSYAVSRRRAEFGVRIALGATSGGVMREVAQGGLKPVVIGVVLGVVGAIAASGALTRFLYDVAPTDLLSLSAAAIAFLVAAGLAVLVPGWRAARTNPLEVLRGE